MDDIVLAHPLPYPAKLSRRRARGVVLVVDTYSAFSRQCHQSRPSRHSKVRPALYIFPQSIGTSDGHPSLSHPFVRCQADGLYLNSHHSRATIPSSDPACGIYSSGHRATLLSGLNYVLKLKSIPQTLSMSTVATSRLRAGLREERV